MTIKKYDIILFGGNYLGHDTPLISFYHEALNLGYDVLLITDPIHYDQKTKSKTLADLIADYSIPHKVLLKLSAEDIDKYIDNDTLGISICSKWIFKKDIINIFNGKLINYHNAKLPQERGAAAYSWRIMRGEKSSELTIHQIVEKIDKGPICEKMQINFKKDLKSPSNYYSFLEKYEKLFFKDFLIKYKKNKKLTFKKIDLSKSYYFPPLDTFSNGWINWSWTCIEICNFINAFSSPFKGASTLLKGNRVFLKDSSVVKTEMKFHPFQSGIITRKKCKY